MIVLVKPEEITKLLPLAIREAEEIGIDRAEINFDKLRKSLKACADKGAIFASKVGNHYSGFIALLPVDSFWSDKQTLCNLCYYVEPEYRNGTGLKLLRTARDFAKSVPLELNIFVDTNTDHARKDLMFKRIGFDCRGGTYRSK